jgi:hypothetical protein
MEDINQILTVYHDALGGHYAFDITYRKIYRQFYWLTLRHDVYTWVQTCDACQKTKDLTKFRVEPLRPIVCLEPGEILTVDYAGPFNPSGPSWYSEGLVEQNSGKGRKSDLVCKGVFPEFINR